MFRNNCTRTEPLIKAILASSPYKFRISRLRPIVLCPTWDEFRIRDVHESLPPPEPAEMRTPHLDSMMP
jgi:hypothetical protein